MTDPGGALTALADPVRRDIMALLGPDEVTVSDLVDRLTISQPRVSKHLAVLRQAALVRVRTAGKWRYYSVDDAGLERVAKWLEQFREAVNQSLDRLEDVVAEIEEGAT